MASKLTATVFNGTSFVGHRVLARLGKSGAQLVVAYRGSRYDVDRYRTVGGLGQVYFSRYHLKDEKSLYEAMRHSNVVVNCIGKQNETKNFSFNEVHVEGARRIAKIAREVGVEKLIHLSAMNASPNPTPVILKNGSQFLKSKYYGEQAVLEEFPDAVIIRPADLVGDGDNFLRHFTAAYRSRFSRKLAIWDYYDGVEKQPILVEDLVSGIEQAILNDSARGKIFQAVGPRRYDFYDLIEYMRACAGQGQKLDQCRITNLRYDWLMRMTIFIFERVRKYPFITWERCERDSISDTIDPKLPTLADLGVKLTPIELTLKLLGDCQPREIRVEIPYELQEQIDPPKVLNAT